jgi:hypothetical protein
VTGGEARRGRRDNGLTAAHYSAAGDVDPRVGEHLLDVLAVNGIAAYLRPSADVNPLTRSSVLPNRPTDRLYVDQAHLEIAREYLARLAADAADDVLPEDDHANDDDVWAEIVAAYESEPQERSWPEAEDLGEARPATAARPDREPDDPPEGRGGATAIEPTGSGPTGTGLFTPTDGTEPPAHQGRASPRGGLGWSEIGTTGRESKPPEPADRDSGWDTHRYDADSPSLLDGLDTFGADLAEEEGYTPPAPPPIPRPSMPTALGLIGVVGGLIVFLKPSLLPINDGAAMILGFTVLVAGFVTLVWRLRPGDDEDEDIDPDDGARV